MNDLLGIENINLENISFTNFIIGFITNIFLSLFLKYSYLKFSLSVSNKTLLANIFPLFSASLFLIVITIKSSLVLSLGLVGALSIIRFRTAIKETEQIVYFLILTAVSIGTAANSFLYSILFVIFVHVYNLFLSKKNFNKIHSVNDQLVISGSHISNEFIEDVVSKLNSLEIRVEIISLTKNTETSTVVLRLSDFDLKSFNVVEEIMKNSKSTNLEIQFFSSVE